MPRIRKIILTLKTVKKTLLGVFAIDMKTIAMGEERGNTTQYIVKITEDLWLWEVGGRWMQRSLDSKQSFHALPRLWEREAP